MRTGGVLVGYFLLWFWMGGSLPSFKKARATDKFTREEAEYYEKRPVGKLYITQNHVWTAYYKDDKKRKLLFEFTVYNPKTRNFEHRFFKFIHFRDAHNNEIYEVLLACRKRVKAGIAHDTLLLHEADYSNSASYSFSTTQTINGKQSEELYTCDPDYPANRYAEYNQGFWPHMTSDIVVRVNTTPEKLEKEKVWK